ncbi:hypothetical protein Moror_15601 [Moniliophthora roreri MCA 2997]|uniref:DUF6535 domain-containing protein n=1 Tax=Moniliophthora roreri (strain MCA 2997) TaxID=1381753 RepID=V2WS97_MONRO|nr:hypothetical protein Moror_15601 [Moniliophthora roreri MCA 2997]
MALKKRTLCTQNINPTQIPLPPSEAGSVQEDEPVHIPESAPSPPELTEGADEDEKARLTHFFLWNVARNDPYMPDPFSLPPASTEEAHEEKKPTRTESWERMLKEVSRHDEDMVKGWRDDIDTLLVFAGLFSAVVTAFAIESYQWLDEDPTDTTVALLAHLISLQVNGSQSISFGPTPFKPDASSIRINVFWFLSLIFSLTSALFGLLCKQWVREHQRDTTTRTPGEALALRQLRRDSFEKWGVSSFLSALPILLEVALLFFFVGVLDLLWNRHHVPFTVCFVAISFSAGLYFLTALLPTLMVPRDQTDDIKDEQFNQLSYQFICPYKSPQAWLVYRLSRLIIRPLLNIPAINDFLHQKARGLWDHVMSPASDWSSFDLWVVRQFDQVYAPLFINPLKVYELRAFEWAVTMFRDSPSMISHLQNVLGTITPSVAVSAVLGRWDCVMWRTVSMRDVEDDFRFSNPDPSLNPTIRYPILQQPEGINLLFHHCYWAEITAYPFLDDDDLDRLIDSIKRADLQHITGLRFVIPFPVVDTLWTNENPTVRAKSLTLLSLFEQSWKPCPGYDERRHNAERLAFAQALADHINRKDSVSALLTSKRGQAFIRFIHNEVVTRRWPSKKGLWYQATKRAQEVGGLPSNYFATIPDSPTDDLPTLPNLDRVRYSIETEPDMQIDNNEVLDIVTSNGTGDTIGAGPLEGNLIRHPRNVDINDNASLERRDIGSSNSIAPDHESGVDGTGRPMVNQEDFIVDDDGNNTDEDNARDDTMKSSGAGKPTDTGILGESSGQCGDIVGGGYSLHSLGQHASDSQNDEEHAARTQT